MNANQGTTMYESIPVVSELNKVQGFDPLKFLRKTKQGGKNLELKYKKLWFRLKYPAGRIKLSALKITDQLAIIEACVYFDKNDTQPKSSFISQRDAKTTPGGLYIEYAQHAAIDQALSDAGFGVQFIQTTPPADTVPMIPTVERQAEAVKPAPVMKSEQQETAAVPVTKTVAEVIPEEMAAESIAESVIEEAVPEQPVADDASTSFTADGELTTTDEEAAEELREVFGQTDETASAEAYTKDMPVETICSMMTYEEAGNVIVPVGTCKGWTLSQVADRRKASLKWYINGYSGDDNILRAAATVLQAALEDEDLQKAS
ncbi:MAG: hypothetical protein HFE65_00010 [Clostridiales bacterium]|nr:hypothetical protein [Clostridiales bacterium]